MLRKKFIALGLIGMTVMVVTTSNTTISIAAPTNAEASDDMMQKEIHRELNNLGKLLNENYYKEAYSLRKKVQHQLKDLSKNGEDVTDLQKRFDELSKQLDVLGKNEKIERIKLSVKYLFRDISTLVDSRDYDPFPHMLSILLKTLDELSKHQPIDESTLERVDDLKYLYDNRELLDKFKDKINSTNDELHKLSKFIKEKNINKAILAKKELSSSIERLEYFLKVPEFIRMKFDLYCENLDELVPSQEEAIVLKN